MYDDTRARGVAFWRRSRQVLAVSAAVMVVSPSLAHADTAAQGETFALSPSSAGNIISDTSAEDGKVLMMWSNASAARSIKTDSTSAKLILRARGQQCNGAPVVAVDVDNVRRLSATVASTAYASYSSELVLPQGDHAVKVTFLNDYKSASCDRNVFVDALKVQSAVASVSPVVTPTPTPTATPAISPPPANVFSTNYSNGLASFASSIHPERIQAVDDPVLGSARRVLKFQVYPGDTGPTENPRAQLETPYDYREGDERYFGFSVNLAPNFPTLLPSGGWVTLSSLAYGPPFNGAGPVGLRIQNHIGGGGSEISWQRNGTYGWDIPWIGPKVADVRGRWVDFVMHVKLHRDPRVGFVEMWTNTGSGWSKQSLKGQSRLYMTTYDSSNGGGANNSRINLYYRKDIPGPLTVFHGPLRISSAVTNAFESVAPHSYG